MANSAQKLKLTASNIRSSLINNNKKIAKLDTKKLSLVRRQRLRAERDAAEKNIEKKKNMGGPIKSVLSNVSGSVMSMGDKILNFFGYLLMGWISTKLPAIIEKLKAAYKFVEPLIKITWNIVKLIARDIFKVGGWIIKLFDRKKSEKNIAALSEGGAVIEKELDSVKIPELDETETKEVRDINKLDTDTDIESAQETRDGRTDDKAVKFTKTSKETLKMGEAPSKEFIEKTRGTQIKKLKFLQKRAASPEAKAEYQKQIDDLNAGSALDSFVSMDPSKLLGKGRGKSGMDGKMSSSISSNVKSNVISKVDRHAGDLKGNLEEINTNTIIMPIEVEKMVGSAQNGFNPSILTPEPVPSNIS